MASDCYMQAASSVDGQLYTWPSDGPDWAGVLYPGPGLALDIVQATPAAFIPVTAGPLGCAIVSPMAATTVLQGRTIMIMGTISRDATVKIYKGATLLGPALVSGLTWSYAWTPSAADVGSVTLNAEAIDTSLIIGDAFPVVVTVQAVLDKSIYSAGIYVANMPGSQGDAIGVVPSLVGTNVLTPSASAPALQLNAVGGNNAALQPNFGAPYQYFTCNALTPYLRSATGNWTLLLHLRIDKPGEQPAVSVMKSTGDSSEQLWLLRLVSETWTVRKNRPGIGAVQSLSGTRCPDPYSSQMVAVRCAAGVISIIDRPSGQTTERITVAGTLDSVDFTAGLDVFALGVTLSSVVYEVASTFQQKLAFTNTALSDANIHTQFNEWQFDNYVLPQAKSIGAISPGDSIMASSQDTITGAGMRDCASALWEAEGLSIYTYGGIQAGGSNNGYGVGRVGGVRNTFSSCLSGQAISSICTQALLDIANSPAPVRYWLCYMGGGDNNVLTPPATICASFVAGFTNVMNAMIATETAGGIQSFADISPIIPLDNGISGGATQANLVAVHAMWQTAVVAPLQAAFPGRVYSCDMYLALGGVWSAQYFGTDTAHPNRAGHAQMALHPLYGRLNAKNELGETVGARFRRASPTAPRLVPLYGSILTPAPAATIPHGTAYTIALDCSRIGSVPVFRVDGIALGICTANDIYDSTVAFGGYPHKPHVTFTHTWTPGSGDIGTRVLSVTYTDLDGTTVATSPTVSVTVS